MLVMYGVKSENDSLLDIGMVVFEVGTEGGNEQFEGFHIFWGKRSGCTHSGVARKSNTSVMRETIQRKRANKVVAGCIAESVIRLRRQL